MEPSSEGEEESFSDVERSIDRSIERVRHGLLQHILRHISTNGVDELRYKENKI